MPSYESSMQNLEKAQERWHPPRRWRSTEESQIIQRFVFLIGRPVETGLGNSGLSLAASSTAALPSATELHTCQPSARIALERADRTCSWSSATRCELPFSFSQDERRFLGRLPLRSSSDSRACVVSSVLCTVSSSRWTLPSKTFTVAFSFWEDFALERRKRFVGMPSAWHMLRLDSKHK